MTATAHARPIEEPADELLPWGETRPLTRGECLGRPRPCPWVSCRHHLYLDVTRHGGLAINACAEEPWDLPESCALDLADRGPLTLEAAGVYLGVTRERIRQIQSKALGRLEAKPAARQAADDTFEERPVVRQPEPSDDDGSGEGQYPCQVLRRERTREGLLTVAVRYGDRTWTLRRSTAHQWVIDELPAAGWAGSSIAAARRLVRALGGQVTSPTPPPPLRAATCDRCHRRAPSVGAPGQPLLCGECAAEETPVETPVDPTQHPERRRPSAPAKAPTISAPAPAEPHPCASFIAGVDKYEPNDRGRPRITDALRAAIAAAVDAGYSHTEIAEAFEIPRGTVSGAIWKWRHRHVATDATPTPSGEAAPPAEPQAPCRCGAPSVVVVGSVGYCAAHGGEALAVATDAVRYLLLRVQVDPNLYYLAGPGTEAFRRLTAAEAAESGEELRTVERRRAEDRHAGSEPEVLELRRRVRELEDGACVQAADISDDTFEAAASCLGVGPEDWHELGPDVLIERLVECVDQLRAEAEELRAARQAARARTEAAQAEAESLAQQLEDAHIALDPDGVGDAGWEARAERQRRALQTAEAQRDALKVLLQAERQAHKLGLEVWP